MTGHSWMYLMTSNGWRNYLLEMPSLGLDSDSTGFKSYCLIPFNPLRSLLRAPPPSEFSLVSPLETLGFSLWGKSAPCWLRSSLSRKALLIWAVGLTRRCPLSTQAGPTLTPKLLGILAPPGIGKKNTPSSHLASTPRPKHPSRTFQRAAFLCPICSDLCHSRTCWKKTQARPLH